MDGSDVADLGGNAASRDSLLCLSDQPSKGRLGPAVEDSIGRKNHRKAHKDPARSGVVSLYGAFQAVCEAQSAAHAAQTPQSQW